MTLQQVVSGLILVCWRGNAKIAGKHVICLPATQQVVNALVR